MEVKGLPEPFTGQPLFMALSLLDRPFEISLPSDRRSRPESASEVHHTPDYPTFLRPHLNRRLLKTSSRQGQIYVLVA
jgi:hypothetical protein